jgi:hypothetical protein
MVRALAGDSTMIKDFPIIPFLRADKHLSA